MPAPGPLAALKIETKLGIAARVEPALGLAVGLGGGVVLSLALGTPVTHGLTTGGLFGLVVGILFVRRATSAGAGLIWGLAAAFLMWLVFPAGLRPWFSAGGRSMAALSDARDQFPLLVAYLVCLECRWGLPSEFGAVYFRTRRSRISTGGEPSWQAPRPACWQVSSLIAGCPQATSSRFSRV